MADSPIPDALVDYLAKRDAQRADKVQAVLDSLTDRERALIHDAAIMGYAQGLMRDRSEGCPKDSAVVHLVVDACFAIPDKYPAINGDLAPHSPTGTWTIETPRRDAWGTWSPAMDDPEWAAERWMSALANSPGRRFRMVRADTVYTVVAEHDPEETE
jgi:hypothetical protein